MQSKCRSHELTGLYRWRYRSNGNLHIWSCLLFILEVLVHVYRIVIIVQKDYIPFHLETETSFSDTRINRGLAAGGWYETPSRALLTSPFPITILLVEFPNGRQGGHIFTDGCADLFQSPLKMNRGKRTPRRVLQ